jgi:DNA-3-methyladenine glycosylase II
MTPNYWQQASAELAQSDPVLAGIVAQYAGSTLVSRGDPFSTLARSIVGQQISVKAADSVWSRFAAALPAASQSISPAAVLAMSSEQLRACGLSARKVEYLGDLARHFSDGQIHTARWAQMSDAEIIAELTAVRGIGVWTAEMFLIFNQLRSDVFPLDDIGLQKAVALHYFSGERPSRQQLAAFGERWRPWRSVATWYLWRSLDPLPVEY